MPREWTSAPDVHLELDVGAAGGRRAALERAVRDAIQSGRLASGTPLPSTRRMAHDLGFARGTVVEAYQQLTSEGYLVAQPGGATKVAATAATAATPNAPPADATATTKTRFDLRPGLLDLAATFPRREWLKSVRAVLNTAPDSAFDYGDPRGRIELRETLAAYLSRARGVVATPDQIVICQGFAHGLGMVAATIHRAGGRSCAMEDPCLPAHRLLMQKSGFHITPLPVDDLGAAAEPTAADVAIVTPAHQYPTGVTLHPTRRAALIAWARRANALIVEDDYDGEFRYDRQPVGALQGLAPNDVIYIGTTSKTLAPGIRVGWMVLPPHLVGAVVEAMGPQPGGTGPPALEQLTLADFIGHGALDRHLRRLRVGYRQRRDLVINTIDRVDQHLTTTGIAAGLHVLVDFAGTPFTEHDIAIEAKRRRIRLAFLSAHRHTPDPSEGGGRGGGLVIGYARPSPTDMPRAMSALAQLFDTSTTS